MIILKFILGYVLFMFMMVFDNILWISKSPEYEDYKEYSKEEKLNYILKQRVIPVLTAWRDILPAIITGFIFSIF